MIGVNTWSSSWGSVIGVPLRGDCRALIPSSAMGVIPLLRGRPQHSFVLCPSGSVPHLLSSTVQPTLPLHFPVSQRN